jgi:hypothetical protein
MKITKKDHVKDAAEIMLEFLNRFDEPQCAEQAAVVREAMLWLERNHFTK